MRISFTELLARHAVIWALNDEHGVNGMAFDHIREMLPRIGAQDILDKVKAQDGRFYLEDAIARELINVHQNVDHSLTRD